MNEIIKNGKTALGIELGSTRIKAVLIDLEGNVLAVGFHDWENSLVDGVWTYSQDEIHQGVKNAYADLKKKVREQYDETLTTIGAMGISAMMHGYLAFDKDMKLLAPFQTWRNSNTGPAADKLTELFDFNIPLRWTISHIYQRILDKAGHVKNIAYVTTLDSYVHYLLTGEKVTGIGDASGIFPIDSEKMDYDQVMVDKFDELIKGENLPFKLRDILPKVLLAGQNAGTLTAAGAAFLDEAGDLKEGVPVCPPEGDAGTGMTATNSVGVRTGNVSAGTSTFAMLVMEKKLSKVYREIDMVTTPTGYPVAMAHANNGTSDLNAWVSLFGEFAKLMGFEADPGALYSKLYTNSLEGDADCGGVLSYGYFSGEGITNMTEGRPVVIRQPDAKFTLANFMRSHLYTSLGAVKMGLDILFKQEGAKCDRMMGHGGFFKTPVVGQRYLAAAVNAPVTVMETAGEGGPWGMALLAAYMLEDTANETLDEYLDKKIFASLKGSVIEPVASDVDGFEKFMEGYRAGLAVERAAVENL